MIEQEIVNYIILAQKHGLAEMEIKQNLLNAGWQAGDVEQNFVHAKAIMEQSGAVRMPESKVQDSASVLQPVEPQAQPEVLAAQNTPEKFLNTASVYANVIRQNAPETEPQLSGGGGRKNILSRPIFWLPVVIIVALAAAAYGYYSLVFANPAKVWTKFTLAAKNPVYNTQFSFTYNDPGQQSSATTASPSLLGLNLSNINLAFAGTSYVDATDNSNPSSESKIQYTFGSGNTNFSTGLQYILLNKVLYLNVGSNPFLDMVSSSLNNGQKIDWLKIDLNEAQNQAGQSEQTAKIYQALASPDFKNQIQKIWENATIIKEDKYLGQQKINGVITLHFQNSVDASALKGLVSQYTQLLSKTLQDSGSPLSAQDSAYINTLAGQLIDKIQVKDLETWVGLFDAKLYQVHLVTSAPSLTSIVSNAGSVSLASAGDTKRISDIRQMAAALELYRNDHNGYPDGQGGKPLDLTPNYIGLLPTAPASEGTCADYYNTYWYTPEGTKAVVNGKTVYSSYQMTFCLGSNSGGYVAGIGELSPSGIKDNIACPSSNPVNCSRAAVQSDQSAQIEQQAVDYVNKLNFGATITADVTYTDYGKTQTLTAPAGAFDVIRQLMDAQTKSGDAKRLADIRQMSSALELYFNDANSYPSNLQALAPKYIGVVPIAPEPAAGACSEQNNAYDYKLLKPGDYQVTFCLGQDTGGYNAGAHTLTQTGIQ
ncbi:MAG: hypothetical protein P4L74_05020 [Candidatus Doudnabacteria bacterium]|nr:hypothetical protein [Candidatus Doudnabacteria bacterium]